MGDLSATARVRHCGSSIDSFFAPFQGSAACPSGNDEKAACCLQGHRRLGTGASALSPQHELSSCEFGALKLCAETWALIEPFSPARAAQRLASLQVLGLPLYGLHQRALSTKCAAVQAEQEAPKLGPRS